MRQTKGYALIFFSILACTLLVICCGCGSGRSSSGPATLSQSQILAAANQITQTFVASSAQMGSDECGNPSDPTQRYYCTIPIASNVACSGGGTVGVTGTNSGDLDYSNTGDTTGILTYTPTNCSIPGSKLVMNGNPGLTFTSSMFYFYGGVSSFTVTATGPINYSSNPTGACQANLTIVASFAGDSHHTVVSCTVSGTACGETIGQNCQ